MNRNTAS
jgi:hypothetical protein